jgi:hypothetical protein
MGLWELAWWEIILFIIGFGVVMYLIIKAPSSPDLTKRYTSSESTSSECSSNISILPDKSEE